MKNLFEKLFISLLRRTSYVRRVEKMAFRDRLTGLYSRGFFDDEFHRLYSLIRSDQKKRSNELKEFCLVFIDLDGFKKINDQLGHKIGDLFLQNFSKQLATFGHFRESDFVARFGGDEFAIILPGCTEEKATEKMLAFAEKTSEHPFQVKGSDKRKIRFSWGVFYVDKNTGDSVDSILNHADAKMYSMKKAHKNRRLEKEKMKK